MGALWWPISGKPWHLLGKENRQAGRGKVCESVAEISARFLLCQHKLKPPHRDFGMHPGLAEGIMFIPNLIPFILLIWIIHTIELPKRRGIPDCLWQRGHPRSSKGTWGPMDKKGSCKFSLWGAISPLHLPPPTPTPVLFPQCVPQLGPQWEKTVVIPLQWERTIFFYV